MSIGAMCQTGRALVQTTSRYVLLGAGFLGAGVLGASCDRAATPVAPARTESVRQTESPALSATELSVIVHSVRESCTTVRGRTNVVAISDDGLRVAVGASDGTVHLGDADVPGNAGALLHRHDARVTCLAFSGSGVRLASGGADGVVRVSGGGVETLALATAGPPLVHVTWSMSGGALLAIGLDGAVHRYAADGTPLGVRRSSHHPASHAEFLGDAGHMIVVSRASGHVAVIDADGTELITVDGLGESGETMTVSPDRETFAIGSIDGRVWLWSRAAGLRTLHRHNAAVRDVAFSPDGEQVVSASLDGTVHTAHRDGSSSRTLAAQGGPVHRARTLNDCALTLTVSADRSARLWTADGTLIATLGGLDDPVTDAAFVLGQRAVMTWSGVGPARLWTLTGQLAGSVLGTERGIVHVRASAGASRVVFVAPDRTARAWSTASGTPELPVTAQMHAAEAFAEPERCAGCHRAEYERWITSSHAWTSTLASATSLPRDVLAGAEVQHSPGLTRFGQDDAGTFAETTGPSGRVERYRLTHVAGHLRMRMLLATMDDGRIQVLPAMTEWPAGPWFDYTHLLYGEPGAALDVPPSVAPGDASFWTGATRSWDQKCALCHTSGRVAVAPGPDGIGPRSSWRSLGVDCETCHGPGRAHSEAWERGETGAPMQRLERLPRATSIAVCTQCHMEGDRVSATYTIGDDLYEVLDPTLALDPRRADPYGRPLELIYDGLPFGTSHCAESGGLTCSACHEPHGSEEVSQLRMARTDRRLCVGCHDPIARAGSAHTHHAATGSGSGCVACHMPFLEIERGHGAVADHTIGVPVMDAPGDRVATDACTWCHTGGRHAPNDAPRIGADALRDAYASWWPESGVPQPWMRALAAARQGDPTASAGVLAVAQEEALPRVVRATATRLLARYADESRAPLFELSHDTDSLVRRSALHALSTMRGADIDARLLSALADPSRATRVVAARTALAGWERVRANDALLRAVIPVLEADTESIPDDYYRWFLLGAARGLAGDDAGALAAYEHVVELDPLAHAVRAHVERLRTRLRAQPRAPR